MKRRLGLLLALASLGCQSNAGLHYDNVHLSVSDEAGVDVSPANSCLTLPLLLGSQVEQRHRIDAQLELVLHADRDRVLVRFDGSGVRAELAREQLAEPLELDVESPSGASYRLVLIGGCPKPST
ncbi:MAG: hypothetical protein KF718_05860 [Polyangiaceae bacterium]|nr:hypothetical protein [Polyangiaceae bacterium]